MDPNATTVDRGAPRVGRQVKLPLSKAAEIAYKSIRLRLSRSLVVTSGIVLALAFLMSILTGEAITDGMRDWVASAAESPAFADLKARRQELERDRQPLDDAIRAAARTDAPALTGDKFDPEKAFGATLADLQKDLDAALPATADEVVNALTRDPALAGTVRQWIDKSREIRDVRAALAAPQQLESDMKQAGVPTTAEEIANARIQTRWLIGLALLVAFVGILNAMLMSVTERFREIGTMKCLGALDGFIIKLFLIESLFQGLVGTVIGVLVGLVLSAVSAGTAYGGQAFRNVPVGDVTTGVLLCIAIGVGLTVAGAVYPAWTAARMQPIEAMRSDV